MLDLIVLFGYLIFIVVMGTLAGKFTTTTSDFFFGGRRFSWWLVGASCVATLVGSYSFIQYSQVGFANGMPSLGPYTNEWFVLPLFLGVWLPIFYYQRLESVPEYFEKRFSWSVRQLVIVFLLVYLTGYVGVNLLTIGVALRGIMAADPELSARLHFDSLANIPTFGGVVDWQLIIPAIIIAVLSAIYLHAGGQTSVIITDLIQGFLLLFVGLGVVWAGISALGGFEAFWTALPEGHRYPYGNFNHPPDYHFVGDFWNDAILNSFGFYVINQGILMRFLSARSVDDGRKAMIFVAVILMPLAAISVGGAGWIGRVMVDQGTLGVGSREIFIAVARELSRPGVYGFVIAAVVAALMSTLDTLITALAAVVVNDIIRPRKPGMPDEYYLEAAKKVAVVATVIGIFLIPVFDQFESIYQALSHFTSIVMPPLVVTVVFGVVFPRFSTRAALNTLIYGGLAMGASILFPNLVAPVAHGVDPSGGYSFMRALYGLVTSGLIAAFGLFAFAESKPVEQGLTIYDVDLAREKFKGGKPDFEEARRPVLVAVKVTGDDGEEVKLPQQVLSDLKLKKGDLLYISDPRWWWGGLRSVHSKVGGVAEGDALEMSEQLFKSGSFFKEMKLTVEKVF